MILKVERNIQNARDLISREHFEIKKTKNQIQTNFYNGMQSDLTSFCCSCLVYQTTVARICFFCTDMKYDKAFKTVAADMIGPILHTSEKSYRYILTYVNYFARTLKLNLSMSILTETITDVLINMYRLGSCITLGHNWY